MNFDDYTNPFKVDDLVVSADEDRAVLLRDWASKNFDPDKMHRVIAVSKYGVTIVQNDGQNDATFTGATGLFVYMGRKS